jgi:AI-2 transport protein TqsA
MLDGAPEDDSDLAAPSTTSRSDLTTLYATAACLVIAAASWYLLRALADVLRPLFLAVLVCYALVPLHGYLKRWLPGMASVALLAVAAAGLLALLAVMLQRNAIELHGDLPALLDRGRAIVDRAQQLWVEHVPPWLSGGDIHAGGTDAAVARRVRAVVDAVINGAAATAGEALVVGFYVLFLLMEAGRFPERVGRAFTGPRADEILKVIAAINTAVEGYLRVKVEASLLLAAPVALILWAFGVKFALMWGVLTFIANFIPYVGSVVAFSLPILFSFLQLELGWEPIALAALVLSCHIITSYVVEPTLTGRVVDLSPVAVLVALAFWAECWGLIGMVLAVPLTVIVKIVLENLSMARPIARLLAEE